MQSKRTAAVSQSERYKLACIQNTAGIIISAACWAAAWTVAEWEVQVFCMSSVQIERAVGPFDAQGLLAIIANNATPTWLEEIIHCAVEKGVLRLLSWETCLMWVGGVQLRGPIRTLRAWPQKSHFLHVSNKIYAWFASAAVQNILIAIVSNLLCWNLFWKNTLKQIAFCSALPNSCIASYDIICAGGKLIELFETCIDDHVEKNFTEWKASSRGAGYCWSVCLNKNQFNIFNSLSPHIYILYVRVREKSKVKVAAVAAIFIVLYSRSPGSKSLRVCVWLAYTI